MKLFSKIIVVDKEDTIKVKLFKTKKMDVENKLNYSERLLL
jgi:hypothetical protein